MSPQRGAVSSPQRGADESAPLALRDLDAIEVDRLKGVGDKRRDALAQVEISSVFDLLTHYPRRYIDRTREARISDVMVSEEAMVVAEVSKVDSRRIANRRHLVQVDVRDPSGRLRLTFFNQQWRAKQLYPGLVVALFGKVDEFRGTKQMTNPVVDLVGDRTGIIVPVYPQSEKAGLMTWDLARWVGEALRRCAARGIADPLPESLLDELDLLDRGTALRMIHQPEAMVDVQGARNRLVFDELLRVQLVLRRRKLQIEAASSGLAHEVDGELVRLLEASLPFDFTAAQSRTMAEIDADLALTQPMHRLLQGDVGAGKTLVALHALLVAVQNGHQGALMAPTEVLAEQHHLGLRGLLGDLDVPDDRTLTGTRPLVVESLTNRVGAADRRRILAGLADGSVDIVVGTHALIQDTVEFDSLSVVVVDEQHRFGVEQRAVLREHGRSDGRMPHLLVMTATPIPRTAAMTVYGDLDVSVLDELPPGRTPIETVWAEDVDSVSAAWTHVRNEVEAGRQAYVVCPLIEESDKLDASSAQATYDELVAGELEGLRLGLLHGRLKGAEKELTMERFRSGELDVLVATTVIEVGVDVPNATTMVILSADRFGIAQLHQLRGRVGRGAHASKCFLITTDEVTEDAQARLRALEESTDGFQLAEVDLDLRGEGTIFDQHQSGQNDLKLASLARDRQWVERARRVAESLLGEGGDLSAHPDVEDEIDWFIARRDDEAEFLLRG
ncbi:MAG: ATP-dependent DNA helicase RecG [Actinomycetota bacterium]|nr:ATP-dependent DNA helicase RecG [Actinomycetota bacterium]